MMMGAGMVPAKKSPMVAKQSKSPPPRVGDDFSPKTTTPNKTTPTMPDRDGPANDMRGASKPQKPKTSARQKAGMPTIKKQSAPAAKAPAKSTMPMKTLMAMKSNIGQMGSF